MHTHIDSSKPTQSAPRFSIAENVARAVSMSSLELVEFINSNRQAGEAVLQHKDFLAKVPRVLGADQSAKFSADYQDTRNRQQKCFIFAKREACLMAMSYSYDLQALVYDRMTALEEQHRSAPIPQTLPEALRLAADLADRNGHLEQALAAQAPKMKAISRLAAAHGALCITDAAKHLQLAPCELFAWLEQNRWIYRRSGSTRWIAMQPRITKGLMTHKVTALKPDKETGLERAAFQPLITTKGLARLAEKLQGGNHGR